MDEGLTSKLGIVRDFNRRTLAVRITLDEGGIAKCLLSVYDSGGPRRPPEVGARVKVLYKEGLLLQVRRLLD